MNENKRLIRPINEDFVLAIGSRHANHDHHTIHAYVRAYPKLKNTCLFQERHT